MVESSSGAPAASRPSANGSPGADHEGAARQFVEEVAFSPGAWERELPPEMRAVFVDNAPTFLDELEDPDQLRVDEDALSQLELPARLTQGSESPPDQLDEPVGEGGDRVLRS